MKKDVRSMKLTMQLKSRSYDIILKAGCLANLHQFTNVQHRKVFVLTDSGVPAAYVQTVRKLLYTGAPNEAALAADRLYIGFWTDKGSCNREIAAFLKQVKGKEVFLFGTAGFGGDAAYFEKVLTAVKKHLDRSNTVIGTYMCQGKMPQSVRERYVKMQASPLPIPNLDSLIENFDRAATHPDAEDLHRLTAAVKQTESR